MTVYWVYVLQCENDHYYTGYTANLAKRYAAHLAGRGAKYTRSFKPLCILQSWQILTGKRDAMRAERWIKCLSRKEKEWLLTHPQALAHFVSSDPE